MTFTILLPAAFLTGFLTHKFLTKNSGKSALVDLNDTLDAIQGQLEDIKDLGFDNFESNLNEELSLSDIRKLLDEMNSPSEDDETQTEATPDNESRE